MILVDYPKARFNYEFLETLEAGLELIGGEVKALRGKHGSLEGAHISLRGNEAFVVGMQIPPYQPKNAPEGYDPKRPRRLLLTKKEISSLIGKEKEGRTTIIPIEVFLKGNKIKIKIAIARGKKKFDKRETIKRREDDRAIRRVLKNSA